MPASVKSKRLQCNNQSLFYGVALDCSRYIKSVTDHEKERRVAHG